jgi:integrase
MSKRRRGRGEGSVYRRADGIWIAYVSLGYNAEGKRKRRFVAGGSKAEALDKLKRLVNSGAAPVGDGDKLTLAEYLRTWLASIKPNVATHTYISYEQHCRNAIIPHLGGTRLPKLTALQIQGFYASMASAGRSAANQRKAGVTLGVALQHAVRLKLIAHNVARDVPKPKHSPKEMQVLDPNQVQAFFAEARADRLFALYVLSLDSGVREGEAFALLWTDIDWTAGAVQIVRALEEAKGTLKLKELKTKKSRRRVALSPFTMEALADHRKAMLAEGNYSPDGPVFCDTEGGWLRKSNVLRRSFRPILKRAGLPTIRVYDLRHSSATLLLLAGEDSRIVAERLGHSSTVLTQNTYQHVLPGMQERAASKLDTIFRQATNGTAKIG